MGEDEGIPTRRREDGGGGEDVWGVDVAARFQLHILDGLIVYIYMYIPCFNRLARWYMFNDVRSIVYSSRSRRCHPRATTVLNPPYQKRYYYLVNHIDRIPRIVG